jgi:acyl-CoA synthetase (AMP-forming)/AMP-acid ligase II
VEGPVNSISHCSAADWTIAALQCALEIEGYLRHDSSTMRLTVYSTFPYGRAGAEAITYDRADGTCEALTFGDLEERSNRAAQLLTRRGLARGDRLCLFLPNRIEYIDLFLACVKTGVIVVPINVLYREREIVPIIVEPTRRQLCKSRARTAHSKWNNI